jgi:dTDP-4-dehydrorhamnose 3,5-epimerase
MTFRETELSGLVLIEPVAPADSRGYFLRTFCSELFAANSLNTAWPQTNLSYTARRGTLRGLHFQRDPAPEIKLIQCLTGRILDVIVDLRKGSATYGKWLSFELSEENHRMLYVPGGFAHGFQCLEDDCRVSYMMSESYVAGLAAGVRWNDPDLAVAWPIPDPLVSPRDVELPLLAELP